MVLTRFIYRLALAFILITRAAGMVLSQKSPSTTKGTVQRIKVHGKSLEENLEGETADPDIFDLPSAGVRDESEWQISCDLSAPRLRAHRSPPTNSSKRF